MRELAELNEILFNQLDILTKINVTDETFENEKARATAVCETADRIIRNNELELRNQVWNATRKFKLINRPQLSIGAASYDEDN